MMEKLRPILIVEDDINDTELMREWFSSHNLSDRTVFVRDGEEALEFLNAAGVYENRDQHAPVAIFLDIKLPKINGLEVLRRIKASPSLRLIPVVMLTSSKQQGDLLTSYEQGANAYVVKPVSSEDFSRALKNLGMFWAALNQPPPVQG